MREKLFAKISVCICLIFVLSVTDLFAGARDHNGGFFLRLSAGGGASLTTLDENLIKYSGASSNTNFAIGGAIFNNLALHATFFGWMIAEPEVEVIGIPGSTDEDILFSAVGIGVTYYIMPINIYLSPSIGIAMLYNESGDRSTDNGIALDMTLGKEWWVGGSWGLGVAGSFGFHSVPERNVDFKWEGYDFSIKFTATLN
jgi:hypothetical protein